jgi:hypothetical protein
VEFLSFGGITLLWFFSYFCFCVGICTFEARSLIGSLKWPVVFQLKYSHCSGRSV